jgi:hypothetical protein
VLYVILANYDLIQIKKFGDLCVVVERIAMIIPFQILVFSIIPIRISKCPLFKSGII